MAAITVTRATPTNVGSWPIGSDSNWVVEMDEDTTGWAVTCDFALTKDGTPFLSYTTAGGGVTVGGGTGGINITVNLLAADTAAWTGAVLYWVVRRTDSGQHDRLAFGTVKPDEPSV